MCKLICDKSVGVCHGSMVMDQWIWIFRCWLLWIGHGYTLDVIVFMDVLMLILYLSKNMYKKVFCTVNFKSMYMVSILVQLACMVSWLWSYLLSFILFFLLLNWMILAIQVISCCHVSMFNQSLLFYFIWSVVLVHSVNHLLIFMVVVGID